MFENRFTRANPGLIVFMIDQSSSMDNDWSDGKSLAEQTALVINRCVAEMIGRFTDIKDGVKESANVVFIGYGGIEQSDKAYVISSATIKKMANSPLKTEKVKQKISDGAGGLLEIENDIPIWIEPKAVWGTPMGDAFNQAYQLVDGWVTKKKNREVTPDAKEGQPQNDPIPIIINISDGAPTDSESDVRTYADKLKSISCPDGTPLIFNVHLSSDNKKTGLAEVQFPKDKSDLPVSDSMAELLFDISSELPEAFVKDAVDHGFNVVGGEKTFISNCKEVEHFIQFLNLGTNVAQPENNPG